MNNSIRSIIWCDDIRPEVTGKVSLIGCYGPQLLSPEFPLRLPKLCAHVVIDIPLESGIKMLKVNMELNKKELSTVNQNVKKMIGSSLNNDQAHIQISINIMSLFMEIPRPSDVLLNIWLDENHLATEKLTVGLLQQ